jgi:cyclic pyranopterin phosphate synthase
MIDQYKRNIEYIRVSVTDRCNLRCVYCMPEEGIEQVGHNQILSYSEIIRICRLAAEEGIKKIKLTGGEPLVRLGLSELLFSLKQINGIEEVTLTTNGVLLAEQIENLVKAGLDGVNISLDTLDAEQYEKLTRRNKLNKALSGIAAALQYPDIRVKVNCVALHGINEEQWAPIAKLAKDRPVDVRFIEMMPIGMGKAYPGSRQDDVMKRLENAYGSPKQLKGKFGNGPATYVQYQGFQGKVGFISAVSHEFCGECNRVRLTSEGFLKSCLQYSNGEHLKKLMDNGIKDDELKKVITKVIFEKPRCHQFTDSNNTTEKENDNLESRQMSRIGG